MEKNFYEILGVQKDIPAAGIVQAFRKLVRENHPDRFKEPEKKAEAEHFLKDVTEAFNHLSNPQRRQEYDKSLASPGGSAMRSPMDQVKEYLQQAISRYRQGDMANAIGLLDHILRVEPANAPALFYAGMIRLRNPKWRAQGTEAVEKAISLEPYNTAWTVEYVKFLMDNGQHIRASRLIEGALEGNPASEELQVLLNSCREGRTGPKP